MAVESSQSSPAKTEVEGGVGCSKREIKRALKSMAYCVSKDHERLVLCSVLVERARTFIQLSATNGHICARVRVPWHGESEVDSVKPVRVGIIQASKLKLAVETVAASELLFVDVPCVEQLDDLWSQWPNLDFIIKPIAQDGSACTVAGFASVYLHAIGQVGKALGVFAPKIRWPESDAEPLQVQFRNVDGLEADLALMPVRL